MPFRYCVAWSVLTIATTGLFAVLANFMRQKIYRDAVFCICKFVGATVGIVLMAAYLLYLATN